MAMDEGKTWISRLNLLFTALINRVKRKVDGEKKSVPYIPGDIVREIMLRVPLETLIACKKVSKEWSNLIHQPRLMKRYWTRMALFFANSNSLCCIQLQSSDGPYPLLKLKVHPIRINGRESSRHLVELDWTRLYYEHLLHWDRSNGVACRNMTFDSRFLVYYMLTNSYTEVNAAPLRRYSRGAAWTHYGFGYDDVDHDHKIMVASKADRGVFWVYSLGNCESRARWKQHRDFPYASYEMTELWPKYRHRYGCALDGVPLLHWLVLTVGGEDRRLVILTYHLNSGRFGEIALPPAVEHDLIDLLSKTSMRLFELDGCLCCGYEYDGLSSFVVWAMKEYGVVESWTKLFSTHRNAMLSFFDADPIVVYERGDGSKAVLFKRQFPRSSVLFWYDINSDEVEKIDSTAWWMVQIERLRQQ